MGYLNGYEIVAFVDQKYHSVATACLETNS